jgi:thiamine pyrophosphokinase
VNRPIVFSGSGVTLLGGGDVQSSDIDLARAIAPILVAVDGGANKARDLGILPKAIVGDFDSVTPETLTYFSGVNQIKITEQESTDFSKALRSTQTEFAIGVGFLGARLDHQLAVLNSIACHGDYPVILIGQDDICFMCPATFQISLPKGTMFSLFPLTDTIVSSSGLEWNLQESRLSPMGKIGTSNVTLGATVGVQTSNRGLVVITQKDQLLKVVATLVPGFEQDVAP